jgi:hypothetical protein
VPKSSEELYDLMHDPDEVHNLASATELARSPEHLPTLQRFRQLLREHLLETRDIGVIPEGVRLQRIGSEAPYDWAKQQPPATLQAWWSAAEEVSSAELPTVDRLLSLLQSNPEIAGNEILRYWGCMGVHRYQGEQVVLEESQRSALERVLRMEVLQDEKPLLRVAAAASLARVSAVPTAVREDVLQILVEHANAKQFDVFTAMAALDALGTMDRESLLTVREAIEQLPAAGPLPHQRYDIGVPRLLDAVQEIIALRK